MENKDENGYHLVEIEVKRIQSYLFSVPRLKHMLGANVLLGHILRHELCGEVKYGVNVGSYYDYDDPGWKDDDPLLNGRIKSVDNPKEYFKKGIISRDGGHFHAVFVNKKDAKAFVYSARNILERKLIGVTTEIRIKPLNSDKKGILQEASSEIELAELPQFQICEESGTLPASEKLKIEKKEKYISISEFNKREAGVNFQNQNRKNNYKDIISLIREELLVINPKTKKEYILPETIDDLADKGGYIAVIHADGNQVGKRLKKWKRKINKNANALVGKALIEHFFHHMRSSVRTSIINAAKLSLDEVNTDEITKLPYQLLMLGGDDLLLVCRPDFALPFITQYAKQLKDKFLPDGKPLSFGAGVVFARKKIPFNRLVDIAESLEKSAKKTYLQKIEQQTENGKEKVLLERSVVDWASVTSSWIGEPLTHRKKSHLVVYDTKDKDNKDITDTLILTAKPYFVLEDFNNNSTLPEKALSLEFLLQRAKGMDNPDSQDLPRSQLKTFVFELAQGRLWSELCYQEMLQKLTPSITQEIELLGKNYKKSPWIEAKKNHYLTHIRDLLELIELKYLGRRLQNKSNEADHSGEKDYEKS
jgi:hypothetical protein